MPRGYIHISLLFFSVILTFSSCRKKGCTDPTSLAYDSQAKKDNGTCTYPLNVKKALFFKTTVKNFDHRLWIFHFNCDAYDFT